MPNFLNNDTVRQTGYQLTALCSVNEREGSLLLKKHRVIQLGCFVIDLTYSAENAVYKEIRWK